MSYYQVMNNRSHLIARKVSDKKGFVRTVYVRPESSTMRSLPSLKSSNNDEEMPGIHWEDADNPRIAALVKKDKRGIDRLDASFPILVGNNGGEIILGAPDELDAHEIYMRGGCVALAYAAAMISGKPLAVFDEKDGNSHSWYGHVALEVSPGVYLDITGDNSSRSIQSYFNNRLEEPIIFDTPELVQKHMNADYAGDVLSEHIAKNVNELGWLVTVDFAKHLLEELNIPFDIDKAKAVTY